MKYWLYSSYFKSFQEYVYFMSFYDKKVYFFHNECADSSKPHSELKLFWWYLVYQNTYSF